MLKGQAGQAYILRTGAKHGADPNHITWYVCQHTVVHDDLFPPH